MITEIFKDFTFEAAHYLPCVPEGHQCARMHGHSYRMRITVRGKVDPHDGMIMDFAEIKNVMQPVLKELLDHHVLNEFLPNPTAENLAGWIVNNVYIPGLAAVEVWETATAGARALPG